MTQPNIRFDDGDAYQRAMGIWSQLAGRRFLDWLSPSSGLQWIDVGCGNGAFTELLCQRCKPSEVHGIDPSEGQLTFARARLVADGARFSQGDAMALPCDRGRFDVAVMALVIFFVPDPAKGVAEMARVVRPGGLVAAYAWDLLGGASPFEPIISEITALGVAPLHPPSMGIERTEALRSLWSDAGLHEIETCEITVERTFVDFDNFWASSTTIGTIPPMLAALSAHSIEIVKARLRARLPADAQGRITYSARANAIKGRVPVDHG